jgi:hypothetical protein
MTSVYSITLKPIYSCPSDELPLGVKLPDGWSLSWHQVETLKALRDPTIDVVFNTARTYATVTCDRQPKLGKGQMGKAV